MEARESSASGADMSLEGRGQSQKVENAPLIGVLVEAAAALEADKVSRGAEPRSTPAPVSIEIKRKRGRPPKGQPKLPPPVKKKKDEEDVCFICYDGGSLVLCDRRGCPKAYHPACVQQDDAFFESNARWDCGWHFCSTCQKSAHYMCYTCTYSLCKGCTWGADYVYVRENKGFCSMCMRTIMLIENKDRREKETVVVDFDDKSSWEYLFKMYWFYLKEKLSLTLDELMKGKSPCKVDSNIVYKGKDLDDVSCKNDLKHPILGIPREEMENFSRSKLNNQHTLLLNGKVSPTKNKLGIDEGSPVAVSEKWASKELLAFVAFVKNGDMSKLSLQDAQTLLLGYVKRNNLQDPSQNCQVICDARLVKLFGKPRVGHIEMLKLLQFHYPIKDESPEDVSKCNIYAAVASQAEGKANNCNGLVMAKEKTGRTLKMEPDKRSPAYINEYAAIDVHNISLIYLRRCLLESLIDKSGKLHDNVVDSFVRISVSGDDREEDICRLVQVVGICKVGTPYKVGENTVDVALEILNLDKKEVISISAISNQAFSEDECRRLRESIKCGLVKHLTVGQILEKSKSLREVIVNDCLEREVLRLNQLRDEANEKGQEKELREFVEKIELMKTPEERQRRLLDVPEVHLDPTMKAKNRSVEAIGLFDDKNQAVFGKTKGSGLKGNEGEAISSKADNRSYKTRSKKLSEFSNIDKNKSKLTTSDSTKASNGGKRVETVVGDSNDSATSLFQPKPQIDVSASSTAVTSMPFYGIAPKASVVTSLSTGTSLSTAVTSMPFPGVAPKTTVTSLSTGTALSLHNNESENSWHYRDPDGNIQGPFCLLMLKKWSISGYFPSDLRIWSIHDKEGDSLLLIDILKRQQTQNKSTSLQHNLDHPIQKVQIAKEKVPSYWNSGSNGSLPLASQDDKQSASCQDKLLQAVGSGLGSNSSNWVTPAFNCIDINKTGSPCLESVKVSDICSKQMGTSQPPECINEDEKLKSGSDDRNRMACETNNGNQSNDQGHLSYSSTNNGNQSNDQGHLSYSSWRPPSLVVPPNRLDLNTSFSYEAKSNLAPSEINSGNNIYPNSSAKEFGPGLISVPLMKPSNSYSANNNHHVTISQTHPTSGWLAMVTDPIDLSNLVEESLSDLLAEVDAMESQVGLPSPTSAMNYIDYLFEDTINDCFPPTGTLNRTLDTGKKNGLRSSGDEVQSIMMINESMGTLQAEPHYEKGRSQGQSSYNWQRDSSASNNRMPPQSSSSSITSHDIFDRVGMRRPSLDTPTHGIMNLGWEGATQSGIMPNHAVNVNVHRTTVGPGGYSERDGHSSGKCSTGISMQSEGERLNDHCVSRNRHSGIGGSGSSNYLRTPQNPF